MSMNIYMNMTSFIKLHDIGKILEEERARSLNFYNKIAHYLALKELHTPNYTFINQIIYILNTNKIWGVAT